VAARTRPAPVREASTTGICPAVEPAFGGAEQLAVIAEGHGHDSDP
jgi:hypothetical protein